MKLPLLAKNSPLFSVAPLVLVGLSLVACDGQPTLIVGEAASSVIEPTITSPAVETQSAAGTEEAIDPAATEIVADDAATELPVVTSSVAIQSRLAEIAATGQIRLMPMGDSITQGVLGAKSYRFELNKMIANSACSMRFVGSQAANFPPTDFYLAHEGYSGHPADVFLSGTRTDNQGVVTAIAYQKPDVVLLHVGSVDIFEGHDVASTLAEIDQMIAAIESTKPGTIVLVANLIPWLSTAAGADRPALIQDLGNQIESYVAESNNPNLYLVDVRTGYTADFMQNDMIHPNQQGDAHIADAFFDRIYSASYCD